METELMAYRKKKYYVTAFFCAVRENVFGKKDMLLWKGVFIGQKIKVPLTNINATLFINFVNISPHGIELYTFHDLFKDHSGIYFYNKLVYQFEIAR